MLRRTFSWAWFTLAGIAVVLALLVTLLRFGSPWLAGLQQQWLNRMLAQHNLSLSIADLGLDWKDYGPVLVLEKLQLQGSEQPRLTLRRALIDMQLWQSLRQWRPVLNEVTLDGLRLELTPAGEKANTDLDELRTLALQAVRKLTLLNAQLVLASPGKPLLELQIPALHWQNRPGLHQGEGRFGFGSAAGQQFVFKGRLEGDDIHSLSGGIYMQAKGVDAGPMLAQARPNDKKVAARLSFEAWLEWQQGELQAALLTLGNSEARWGGDHQVAVKGGRIQWQPTQQGWQLASSGIDISVDGESWPSWKVQLDRHNNKLTGYLDRLSLTDVALLAQWGEHYWPAAARQLTGAAPAGELARLYLEADIPSAGSDWQLQGEYRHVGTQAFEWIPGVRGLQGSFVVAADHGRLSVQQPEASAWQWDSAFRHAWPVQQLQAQWQWQKRKDGWWLWSDALRLAGDDLDVDAHISLQLPANDSPLLSASASVELHRAGAAGGYLPEPVMGTPLVDYLEGAIVAGQASQAKVLWYGRLNQFPYHDGSGLFQARVPLRHAEFRFDPDWQPLTDLDLELLFENDNLYMQQGSGRLGAARAVDIDARITPLDENAHLELNAGVSGAGEAVTDYLTQSPLKSSVGVALEQIQVSGPLTGRLALNIPLSGGDVGVDGEVDFSGNQVQVTPLAMPLTKVTGTLMFDQQETRLAGLQTQWLGQPLTVNYAGQVTNAGYDATIELAGRLQGDALAKAQPGLAALSGETRWQGDVTLRLQQGEVGYDARLSSDLNGLHSELPAPLAKEADWTRPVKLNVSGNATQAQAQLSLAPDLDADAVLEFSDAGTTIRRLWVTAGGADAAGPRAALDIAAHLEALALDEWIALSETQGQQQPQQMKLHWPEDYRMALRADRGTLWGQLLSDLRLGVTPEAAERRRLTIDSQQVKGSLTWADGEPVTALFERLWLDPQTNESGGVPDALSPSDIPALVFRCDDCRWRNLSLGKMGLQLTPLQAQNGISLDDLWLDGDQLQGRVQGQWLQQQGLNTSRIQWQGGAQSLQQLWRALGHASPFRDTKALIEAQLNWPGLPWQPEPATLNGTVSVETGAGVLTGVSDKGAGLLSVLSMDSVLRRLRLDFRDVFEGGFYFDRISATGEFNNGVLHNNDFLLEGAAGDLTGKGLVDLPASQLNYRFDFTPDLTGNLPVLTAFAVTPVTGLYVLAASKLFGPVVDVFTRIRYEVTGPLASPEVKELGREQNKIKLPAINKEP